MAQDPQQLPQVIDRTAGAMVPALETVELLGLLGLGCLLSLITAWHFRRFGSTLANRSEFAQVIPFVVLTTILIISVVKSQLALSLGMVGALSIVRFRTPIKEPEELAYLFLALAIGIGLGANQWRATAAAAAVILLLMALLKRVRHRDDGRNLYLSVDLAGTPPEGCLARLNEIIGQHAEGCDLRRFDVRDTSLEATYLVDVANTGALDSLSDALRRSFPAIGVTFLDQSRMTSG